MRICPQCRSVFQEDGVYCPHDRAGLLPMRADDARCGTLVDGRFLLLSRLGRGGMGTVYVAWQTSTARTVALKLLAEAVREDAVALERFMREARVTASLRCPHTVRVFDFGLLSEGVPYLAMELVEGITLDALIAQEKQAITPPRAIELVRQICLALEEAHGLGLVHRDLKPSNIMVTRMADGGDFARVLDFGVAKIMDDDSTALTAENSNPGTPAYMAPEQARSEPVGPPADIYAVAVMFYEMLAGERPFTGNSAVAVLVQHAQTPPPRLKEKRPNLPGVEALDAVLQRGLAKRPADRYGDAAALRDDLDRLRTGTAPLAALALAATAEANPTGPGKKRMLGLNFQALGCSVQLAIAVGALALFILPTWRDAEAPPMESAAPLSMQPTALEQAAIAPPTEGELRSPERGLKLEEERARAEAFDDAPASAAAPAPLNTGSAGAAPLDAPEKGKALANARRSPAKIEPPPPSPRAMAAPPPAPVSRPDPKTEAPLRPVDSAAGDIPEADEDEPKIDRPTGFAGGAPPPVPPPGVGPQDKATISPRLARAQALRPELARCGPAPLPSYRLRLTVARDGRVWAVEPLEPELAPLSGCLKRVAGTWIFDPPPPETEIFDLSVP